MTDNIDWMRKNRGIKGPETKHSTRWEETQKYRAMSELFIRRNTNTEKWRQTNEWERINTRASTNYIDVRVKNKRVESLREFLQEGLVLFRNPHLRGQWGSHLYWLSRDITLMRSVVCMCILRVIIWICIEIVSRDMSIMAWGGTHVFLLSKVWPISIRGSFSGNPRMIIISSKRITMYI